MSVFMFGPQYSPGVDSACGRNEYQQYVVGGKRRWCTGLTTLPPLCAGCLEILAASIIWGPKGLSRPVIG